jgi:N-methyl-L-proline demethylase
MRFNVLAEADDVRAEDPDIVVVATGGLPNLSCLEAGCELPSPAGTFFPAT